MVVMVVVVVQGPTIFLSSAGLRDDEAGRGDWGHAEPS